MSLWNSKDPERRAERRRRALALLGLYLDDLLMVSGGACFTAAAALRWGLAAGLAAGGVCLVVLSVLVAKAWRR